MGWGAREGVRFWVWGLLWCVALRPAAAYPCEPLHAKTPIPSFPPPGRLPGEAWHLAELGHLDCAIYSSLPTSALAPQRSCGPPKPYPRPQDAFLEKHGVKLGFMSAFVKAAAEALREVPAVNAVIDEDEIVYR